MVTSGSPATATKAAPEVPVHPSPHCPRPSVRPRTLRILKIQWTGIHRLQRRRLSRYNHLPLTCHKNEYPAVEIGSIVWANDVANGAQVTSSANSTPKPAFSGWQSHGSGQSWATAVAAHSKAQQKSARSSRTPLSAIEVFRSFIRTGIRRWSEKRFIQC